MASRFIKVQPFDLVVFGGTGDLAYRKLFPALFHREMSDQFTDPTRIIGAARRPLDEGAFREYRAQCVVRRFAPEEDPVEGRLARRGERWFFDYGDDAGADEPLYRLGEHRFAVGEYVSISDEDGRLLTYKVTEVAPA